MLSEPDEFADIDLSADDLFADLGTLSEFTPSGEEPASDPPAAADLPDVDYSAGRCSRLPLEDGMTLFYPVSDGGRMKQTHAYPKADSHDEARRVCGPCPIIGQCLTVALVADSWTFRGGMSPQERAAFGGYLDKEARKRPRRLTRQEVWLRLLDSGMDTHAIGAVLDSHRQRLIAEPGLATTLGWREDAATITDWPTADHTAPEAGLRIPAEVIDAARTNTANGHGGGWSRETLQGWGITQWPPPRGWRKALIEGTPIEQNTAP